VQNKDKPKKGVLPDDMMATRYEAAVTVGDAWINYPWEALDIDEHDAHAELNRKAGKQ
jgi:hypoxanthine phosphoribosyltransferase